MGINEQLQQRRKGRIGVPQRKSFDFSANELALGVNSEVARLSGGKLVVRMTCSKRTSLG